MDDQVCAQVAEGSVWEQDDGGEDVVVVAGLVGVVSSLLLSRLPLASFASGRLLNTPCSRHASLFRPNTTPPFPAYMHHTDTIPRQKNAQSSFKKPGKHGMGMHRAILLTGSPGIGKTTSAHLCARMAGYTAVELNASDTRSKKLVEVRWPS